MKQLNLKIKKFVYVMSLTCLFTSVACFAQQINLATQIKGTLGVTHGGTGTATPMTQGSILFAGAFGVHSQDNANFNRDASTGMIRFGSGSVGAVWPFNATIDTPDRVVIAKGTMASPVASTNPLISITSSASGSLAANMAEVTIYTSRTDGDTAGIAIASHPLTPGKQGGAISGHVLMDSGTGSGAGVHASGFPLWITCQLWNAYDNCSNEINPTNVGSDAPGTGEYAASGLSNGLAIVAAGTKKSSSALYIGTQDTVNAPFRRGIDFQNGSIFNYAVVLPNNKALSAYDSAGTNIYNLLKIDSLGNTTLGTGGFFYFQNSVPQNIATLTNAGELSAVASVSAGTSLAAATFIKAGVGAVLSVSGNAIVLTHYIHHVGAGLIKTINLPATGFTGCANIIPDSAFTYDATGNIVVPAGGGTAVVNRLWIICYDGSKWTPSY